jgi:hypothetical protein
MYQDNQFKFFTVVNRTMRPGRGANVIAHGANALQRQLRDDATQRYVSYRDADGKEHGEFPLWPYIILESPGSDRLRNLRLKLEQAGIRPLAIVSAMIGASTEDQLRATAAAPESAHEYLGLFFYGPAELLDPICKRFSCFKTFQGDQPQAQAQPASADGPAQ